MEEEISVQDLISNFVYIAKLCDVGQIPKKLYGALLYSMNKYLENNLGEILDNHGAWKQNYGDLDFIFKKFIEIVEEYE